MSLLRKTLIGLASALIVFTVVGFFILPPIVKSVLTDQASQLLSRPVRIGEIKINPYLFTVKVRGLEIRERSGPDVFVSFQELYVNLDTFSIFRRALILSEIRLTGPYVRIIRNADTSYNFSDLLTKFGGPKADEEKKKTPFLFSLNNIRVEGGSVDFSDGPVKTNHQLRDLVVAIPFISNTSYQKNLFTEPAISAKINGTPYSFRGKTKPFADSLETDLDIDITDLNISHYLAYIPVEFNFKLISALLDTKVNLAYTQYRDKKPTLKISGDMALKKLALDDKKGRSLVRLPLLGVSMASVQPLISSLHFSKILLTSPEMAIYRGKQGELLLPALLPPPGKQEASKGSKKDAKEAKRDPNKETTPLLLRVDEFQVAQGKVAFKDEQPSQPVSLTLSDLNVQVKDFVTAKDSKALLNLSVVFDKGGMISATGPFGIDPLTSELKLSIKNIPIRPLQAYFTDQVKINVTGGSISASGTADMKDQGGDKGLSATYNGNLLVADFGSIDKANARDFLKWKSLFLKEMRVDYNPLAVNIKQIALADFFVRLVIKADGTTNLQDILEKKGDAAGESSAPSGGKDAAVAAKPPETVAAKAPAPDKKEAAAIKIEAMTLQGGQVDFLDRFVKPSYAATLSQIGGRVSGLSSIGEKPADVEFRGQFNHHFPLEITGKIHPFQKDLFVDLKASFKDMDLSPVSPYSGRHIGYNIQKGKLSFDLKYLIVNKKLQSENKIFIDQLTLGEPVESPEALKIPVGLAIALLKDRHGQINLDFPVAGTTDDPEFSIGRLIIQVIVNLITKAVTAPFALLGNLFGGGEELSYLEFDAGRAAVTEANRKKIGTLVKALQERPALKLDIEGHADPEKDQEGLKTDRMERKVKALKLNEMIKQGLAAAPLDEIRIAPEEYERLLTQVYLAEKFPKPRTAAGLIKKLSVAEMEKLMLTHAVVTEADLKLLAARRASAVHDLVLKSGHVPAERVFILESKSLAAEKKEGVKGSRVDFKLK